MCLEKEKCFAACSDRYKELPAFLGSLIATQKSCKGLGSEAIARDESSAIVAMVIRNGVPMVVVDEI